MIHLKTYKIKDFVINVVVNTELNERYIKIKRVLK